MIRKKFNTHVVLILLLLLLASCTLVKPTPDLTGLDQPVVLGPYQVRITSAAIRSAYANYYIMHYPPPTQVFYAITADIQGFDNPQSALTWGKQNFQLLGKLGPAELVYATWVLVGNNIQYKSGQDFKYQYVFYYLVPKTEDHKQYQLQLSDQYLLQVNAILELSGYMETKNEPATPDEGTPAAEELPQGVGELATVGGGSQNTASAYHTTISGGFLNSASSAYAMIGGGRENAATNLYATVAGGYANQASGRDSVIAGGSRNTASAYHAVIAGGIRNQATASDTTIAGGSYNQASDLYATVAGGTRNIASGSAAVVSGGAGNSASADQATVSGGLGNQATANYAVISGGRDNTASGYYSTIPGGASNQVGSDYSLAAGHRAIIATEHPGTFLFADSKEADFLSASPDEFAVRATGGVRLVTGIDTDGTPLSGLLLTAGSGTWATLSDQAMKQNYHPIDPQQILASVVSLPISEWNYTTEDPAIHHIGPVAQDFYAAFGTGHNNRYITTVDADGVALAAIQGLYQSIEEKEARIQTLEARLSALETRSHLVTLLVITLILTIILLYFKKAALPHNHLPTNHHSRPR